ncbi:MAG: AI-2E family transporter [Vicinamibacterales bacterium]
MKTTDPWMTFAGCVLVIGVLYWAQPVLVPIAVAALITFVLTPMVHALERRIGRTAATLGVVALVFGALGGAGWGFGREMTSLVAELPGYRDNIREKVAFVRGMSRGGSVEQLQSTIDDIQEELNENQAPSGTTAKPMVVESQQVAGLWAFPTWAGTLMEPLATAALVAILVIFMLLERHDIRDRLIVLLGQGRVATTTRAFDEATWRVSRYLLMQTLVNVTYGVAVGIGLWLIGVPHALLWASTAAALRYIPYIGPWIAAAAPLAVSLAALPGWTPALWTFGLFVALELFTNLVLETLLYAGAAGVSQVALLVAIAFWTWLWGPLGLLMATPLTVCLVVVGKHVAGLEFFATLMADSPALTPEASFYQRLLARDQSEASDIVDRFVRENPHEQVFDTLLLPALNFAELDRVEGRLSAEEESAMIDMVRELMADADALGRSEAGASAAVDADTSALVLGYPVNPPADTLALEMLQRMLASSGVALEVAPSRLMVSDVVALVNAGSYRAICIADLPPSPASKSRYLIKKLHHILPGMTIIVGRWAPAALIEESSALLNEAGATVVSNTLLDTRDRLIALATHASPEPAAPPDGVAVAAQP